MEKARRFSASGGPYKGVTFLQETGGAVNGLSRGKKTGRALHTAQGMGKVHAGNTGVAAAGGADPRRARQNVNSPGKGVQIQSVSGGQDRIAFDIESGKSAIFSFWFHKITSFLCAFCSRKAGKISVYSEVCFCAPIIFEKIQLYFYHICFLCCLQYLF